MFVTNLCVNYNKRICRFVGSDFALYKVTSEENYIGEGKKRNRRRSPFREENVVVLEILLPEIAQYLILETPE